jgi:4-diphosphocytidyl-2-C-methyl-D-erythritol kinase
MSGATPPPAAGTVTAPAKLTLSLRVTGRRPDGYHLLDAEMVTLDLADTLTFGPGEGLEVVDEMAGGPGLGGLEVGPANLVARALALVGRRAAVRVVKRIPLGAGLGGGSADAAAVLRWAGWRPGAGELAAAATLGADVPFCLAGGHARVRGVGEQVEPLAAVDRSFVLLLPPLAVDTGAAYRAFDELGASPGGAGDGGNDLEAAALAVEPALAAWRDAFGGLTGCRPRLAGSGATWFVEGTPHELGLHGLTSMGLAGDGSGPRARLVAVRTASSPSVDT